MALFGKKTKTQEKPSDEKNVLDMAKEHKAAAPTVLKENTGRAHHVLKHTHLSEKTNQLASLGRYVFKVDTTANKIEVKKAVEQVYDVHVVSVNMVTVSGKRRRQGRVMGRTQDWKKAIVTLKEGERILGLSEGV